MPTYEYQCDHCGHRFEQFQQMSHPPLRKCPRCGKRIRRLLGAGSAVILKGSGAGPESFPSCRGTCPHVDRSTGRRPCEP